MSPFCVCAGTSGVRCGARPRAGRSVAARSPVRGTPPPGWRPRRASPVRAASCRDTRSGFSDPEISAGVCEWRRQNGAVHTPPVAPRTLVQTPPHAHGDTCTRRHARRRATEKEKRCVPASVGPTCRSTAQRRRPEWVRCHIAVFVFALHATTARFSAGSCVTSGVPIAKSFAPGFKPARTIGPSISSCQAHRSDEPHQVKGAASNHRRGSASAHLENLSGDLWAVALKVNCLAGKGQRRRDSRR